MYKELNIPAYVDKEFILMIILYVDLYKEFALMFTLYVGLYKTFTFDVVISAFNAL